LKKYFLNVFQNILKDAKRNPKEAAFIVKFGIGIKMSDRRRKYHKEKGEEAPKILIGTLDGNCNYFCRECYKRNNKKIIDGQQDILNSMQWKKIINRARNLGVITFVFAGGEPLKRRDILNEAAKVKSIVFPTVVSVDSVTDGDINFFNENRNIVPVIRLNGNCDMEAQQFVKLAKVLFKAKIYYGVIIDVDKKNIKMAVSNEFVDGLWKNGCKAVIFTEKDDVLDNVDRQFLKKNEKILRKSYSNVLFYYISKDDKQANTCLGSGKEVYQINSNGNINKCIYRK